MTQAMEPNQTPCGTPEHRQFDFWLGTWEVRNAEGEVVGSNRVVELLGGCVIQENWEGAGGVVGTSYNTYSAARKQWHQTWVDSQGSLLLLNGGLEDGAMVLSGTTPARDGSSAGESTKMVHHRITWSMIDGDPDRVRQHWQVSTDDGKSWQTVFDGLYVRLKQSP